MVGLAGKMCAGPFRVAARYIQILSLSDCFTTTDSKWTARSGTGSLPADRAPVWRRYVFTFTTPAQIGDVVFKFADRSNGGCGNDFALDDILVTRCDTIRPEPVKQERVKQPPIKQEPKPVVSKPVERPKPVITVPVKKDTITRSTTAEIPPVIKPVVKDPVVMPKPVSRYYR
ncbi:MAG: hypothetical protein WDO16_13820 [Bacteroidota bacterium]